MFKSYGVFKSCESFVLSERFQKEAQPWFRQPPLESFKGIKEMLAFLNIRFNDACLGEVRHQNEILKRLIAIHHGKSFQLDMQPLFLLIFQPAIRKLFCGYRWIDPTGDDVGQIIFSYLLRTINRYPLQNRPEKIAANIVMDTKHWTAKWAAKQNRRIMTELPEEEHETSRIVSGFDNALISLIDLANGFGHDETTDRICFKIEKLYKKGCITAQERRILTARLIYQETLRNLVPHKEYELWKKRIRVLTKKYFK